MKCGERVIHKETGITGVVVPFSQSGRGSDDGSDDEGYLCVLCDDWHKGWVGIHNPYFSCSRRHSFHEWEPEASALKRKAMYGSM